jgi:hypothetical protein
MSRLELISQELDRLPECEFDKLLDFVRTLNNGSGETALLARAAESSLAKDWLTPEEDEAWADL